MHLFIVKSNSIPKTKQMTGATLIEVLIAVIILSVGLLGLAGMQSMGFQMNRDAHLRSVATTLAYTAIEQMRTDPVNALNGTYSGTLIQASSSGTCTQATATVTANKLCWQVVLRDQFGSGSIIIAGPTVSAGTNTFTLRVTWTDNWAEKGGTALTNQALVEFQI